MKPDKALVPVIFLFMLMMLAYSKNFACNAVGGYYSVAAGVCVYPDPWE
jgi:hypothetical protein